MMVAQKEDARRDASRQRATYPHVMAVEGRSPGRQTLWFYSIASTGFRPLHLTMAIDDSSSTTTRLLTLLNVSATKAGKRKRTYEESKPVEKLNKKCTVQIAPPEDSDKTPEPVDSWENDVVRMQEDVQERADVEEDDTGARTVGLFACTKLIHIGIPCRECC